MHLRDIEEYGGWGRSLQWLSGVWLAWSIGYCYYHSDRKNGIRRSDWSKILDLRCLGDIQKLDMCTWNSGEKSRLQINLGVFSTYIIITAMGVDETAQSVKWKKKNSENEIPGNTNLLRCRKRNSQRRLRRNDQRGRAEPGEAPNLGRVWKRRRLIQSSILAVFSLWLRLQPPY